MKKESLPSIEYLHECFSHEDGKLFWKNRPVHHFSSPSVQKMVNTNMAGKQSGFVGKDGYILVRVQRRLIIAHGVIWAMETGKWPDCELDHMDRNRSNNRISNLREATRPQNMANRGAHADNRLKLKGVTEHTKGIYRARIYVDGKNVHLGLFSDPNEASNAYQLAEKLHHKEFAGS